MLAPSHSIYNSFYNLRSTRSIHCFIILNLHQITTWVRWRCLILLGNNAKEKAMSGELGGRRLWSFLVFEYFSIDCTEIWWSRQPLGRTANEPEDSNINLSSPLLPPAKCELLTGSQVITKTRQARLSQEFSNENILSGLARLQNFSNISTVQKLYEIKPVRCFISLQ